jgi:hypothetical protein
MLLLGGLSLDPDGQRRPARAQPVTAPPELIAQAAPPYLGTSAAVPPAYRGMHAILQTALNDFDKYLNAQPKTQGPQPTLTYAADLLLANSNRGQDLLKADTINGVRLELDRFRQLGLTGVTVSVNYPLLMPDFPGHDGYLSFFREVAREVRRRGMKLDVEAGAVFANTAFASNLPPYRYMSASFDQYKSALKAMVTTIIREMQPDYVNIGSEPDIGAAITGIKEFLSPRKNAEYVDFVLKDLDRGRTKLAAGFGTWGNLDYIKELVGTRLECIDIHIYPFHTPSQLTNAVNAAELARQHGKCVIFDEVWLSKTVTNEGNAAANPDIFKRDAYSFWAPLDQQFIAEIVKLARIKGGELVSPFWSTYLFAYIDYSRETDALPYAQVNAKVVQAEVASLINGTFSPTGLYYQRLIRERP